MTKEDEGQKRAEAMYAAEASGRLDRSVAVGRGRLSDPGALLKLLRGRGAGRVIRRTYRPRTETMAEAEAEKWERCMGT
jgi:hypothetical protein